MNRVVVNGEMQAKLAAAKQPAELCDETGNLLGYFTPASDRSLYAGVECPLSEEELAERDRTFSGRPLDEIMADLENQQ